MAKRTKFQVRSDASKQRWVRDDRKEAYWRKQIEAWRQSGLSKRGYCIANGVSESSFNSWNREIQMRDREKEPSRNAAELLSAPAKNPFVPIRIVPKCAKEKVLQSSPAKDRAEQKSIEICLSDGVVIRLHDGCDPSFVGRLLLSLKSEVNI